MYTVGMKLRKEDWSGLKMNKDGSFKFYRLYIMNKTRNIDWYRLQLIWIDNGRRITDGPILSIEFYYVNTNNLLLTNRIGLIESPIMHPMYRMLYSNKYDLKLYRRWIDEWPEYSEFNDTILGYIEKYCGIVNPDIV